MKAALNIQVEAFSEKYLGLPTEVGKSTNGAFKYTKDRLWGKIQGWIEKCLAAAGKEVLIKCVAQAILVFSMSCFKLPRGLCDHIKTTIRKFWWGCKQGERKPA